MIVYLNGRYYDAKEAKIEIFDPGFLFGDGIFETLRTYKGKVWQLEEHLDRLFESAKMRGWRMAWKRKEIAKAVENTVGCNNYKECRIRITVTPGVKKPTLFIWVHELQPVPKTAYTRGVSAITFPLERPFPQMKTTSMQPLLIARVEMQKRRTFEAILINGKGNITEGTWTNVFIVKDKVLITPKLGVLLGKTRDLILQIAKPLFNIKQINILVKDLMEADECFLTNSTKGIVPVVKVDGEKIGNGRRGPVTRHLMKEFATTTRPPGGPPPHPKHSIPR